MRCVKCETRAMIWQGNKMIPCPDCHAGQQHCCDGEAFCFPVYPSNENEANILKPTIKRMENFP